ncbi:MAG TPA: ABC-F family ATP-binding cassette domain-containing protein [Gemmatimonadales bacterium]|nr:ABC-F family ATP-binding cassette domain-containing protein [Gemmatimonadales bacterium]
MTVLSFADITIAFAGVPLVREVTFTVARGDRWGVVGRNGTGKTTLFRLIEGELAPTRGVVSRAAALRVGLLDQHREFTEFASPWEVAAAPVAGLLARERELAELADRIAALGERCPPELLERYGHQLERFQREDGYRVAARVDAVLHGLGFDPAEARTRGIAGLSGGERGRLGLAAQLVAAPDLLLLDEPTNHLDLETTAWLEQYLLGFGGTSLVVSHDRAFLERVVDHVLHVEGGTATPYAAGWSGFMHQHGERRLAEQRTFEQQRLAIAAEEEYIRRNIAGQNSRQAKGRRRRLARVERLSAPPGDEGAMALRLSTPGRGGDQVLVAERLRLEAAGRTLLEDFTATIRRGEVVGLIGPNGAGKSTLLHAIAGERQPEAGMVRVPPSLAVAYYRQDLTQVPTELTLYDVIAGLRPHWGRGAVQDHLGRFGFSGDEVLRVAGTLSGGERARLALAMLMLESAHLLLLDEPTNHLDVESIEALEDSIEAYDGSIILVSHDRELLRAVTTRVWRLAEGRITDFGGGFAEWEESGAPRGERRHAPPDLAARRRVRDKESRRAADAERRGRRSSLRAGRRELAEAEAAAHAAEGRVAELAARLDEPADYTAPDARERAGALSAELARARQALDAALERWAAAGAAMEALEATDPAEP